MKVFLFSEVTTLSLMFVKTRYRVVFKIFQCASDYGYFPDMKGLKPLVAQVGYLRWLSAGFLHGLRGMVT